MNTSSLVLLKLEQMECCTNCVETAYPGADLLVLSEPFGCNSALEKGNCSWIDQENRRNRIHDETLQSFSNALVACC